MIIGFAHLILSTAATDSAVGQWCAKGWNEQFYDRHVANPAEKWPLMAGRAEFHDIRLLGGPVNVEMVAHDTGTVGRPARLLFAPGDEMPAMRVRDAAAESAFFVEALGFSAQEGGVLAMTSKFPQWSLRLRLTEDSDAPLDPPLDLEGISCIAFYASSLDRDVSRLQGLGGRAATDPFAITVNDRTFRIVMLRSPEGTIIELIQLERPA